jgi:hypothetical protein
MTLTVSVDDQTISRARERAAALGKSLDELLRDYLQSLAGDDQAERDIAELKRLAMETGGHSHGQRWTREELHERS